MEILISVVIAIILLTILVFGLHRYQVNKAESNANENLPLPPLGSESGHVKATVLDSIDDDEALTTTIEPQAASASIPDMTATRPPGESPSPLRPESDTAPPQRQETILSPAQEPKPDPAPKPETIQAAETTGDVGNEANWADQVAQLKKSGNYPDALRICQQTYPLWSAYQQATIIYRAMIKNRQKDKADFTAELAALYHTACIGAFLHDRVKDLPELPIQSLKQLNMNSISSLDMPYREIGYLELRLIKKTDIKLLTDAWGKPDSHQSPRRFHSDRWNEIVTTGNLQSPLPGL